MGKEFGNIQKREAADEGSYTQSENEPATSQQAHKIKVNKQANKQTNKNLRIVTHDCNLNSLSFS